MTPITTSSTFWTSCPTSRRPPTPSLATRRPWHCRRLWERTEGRACRQNLAQIRQILVAEVGRKGVFGRAPRAALGPERDVGPWLVKSVIVMSDALERGRESFEREAWGDAYALLSEAD